jgi:galactose mutarotase-like enzyme
MKIKLALLLILTVSLPARSADQVIPIVSNRWQVRPFVKTHSQLRAIPIGCSVEKKVLHGGKSEGVEQVTIDNGVLQITVIPTRGMNILNVKHKGKDFLKWDSPVKDVVHPSYVNLESRGGLGWLEGFNEWMVRCGLEFAGHPGLDKFISNTGDEAEMQLTLHGKIGNIPASTCDVVIQKEAPYRITIRGTVYERLFYGPKLKLVTELSTLPGSNEFTVTDRVTNQGAFDQEMQLIYHANYGSPLLEGGAQVITAAKDVTPMNAHAAKAIKSWNVYNAPTKGFIEEVYLLNPIADKNKTTMAVLKNKAGTRASSVSWSIDQLPYLTIWKNTAAKADGYVTGIEPATGFPFNRSVERKAGRVPILKPNETKTFSLTYGIHVGVDEVNAAVSKVQAIQGAAKTVLNSKPPKTDE